MVHFTRANNFIARAFAIMLGALSASAHKEITQADETDLSQERKAIKLVHDGFMLELEKNIAYLPKENHIIYLNELAALFIFPSIQFQVANDLTQQLFLKHGTAYQTAALAKAKEILLFTPLTEEKQHRAGLLLLIATGGSAYYQKAVAEIQRQLQVAGGVVSPSVNNVLIESLIKKHVPGLHIPDLVTQSAPSIQLSMRQIVLQCIYEDRALNLIVATQLALKAGYASPTSGQKLMSYYNGLAHHTRNRIGVDARALSYMIKDITHIIPILTGEAREKAERELQTLKAKK